MYIWFLFPFNSQPPLFFKTVLPLNTVISPAKDSSSPFSPHTKCKLISRTSYDCKTKYFFLIVYDIHYYSSYFLFCVLTMLNSTHVPHLKFSLHFCFFILQPFNKWNDKKKKPTKKNLLLENRWPSSCTSRTSIPGVRLTPCLFCFLLLIYLFLMENFLNKVISLLFKKIFSSYFIGINLLACGDLILGDAIFKIL